MESIVLMVSLKKQSKAFRELRTVITFVEFVVNWVNKDFGNFLNICVYSVDNNVLRKKIIMVCQLYMHFRHF